MQENEKINSVEPSEPKAVKSFKCSSAGADWHILIISALVAVIVVLAYHFIINCCCRKEYKTLIVQTATCEKCTMAEKGFGKKEWRKKGGHPHLRKMHCRPDGQRPDLRNKKFRMIKAAPAPAVEAPASAPASEPGK